MIKDPMTKIICNKVSSSPLRGSHTDYVQLIQVLGLAALDSYMVRVQVNNYYSCSNVMLLL